MQGHKELKEPQRTRSIFFVPFVPSWFLVTLHLMSKVTKSSKNHNEHEVFSLCPSGLLVFFVTLYLMSSWFHFLKILSEHKGADQE